MNNIIVLASIARKLQRFSGTKCAALYLKNQGISLDNALKILT